MSPTPAKRSWVEQIMGLPISLLARGPLADAPEAHRAARAVFDELLHVEQAFSPYQHDSEVSRISRGELSLAEASEEMRTVHANCLAASEATGGLFDATRPDGTWDPSGLVKGWAAERAFRHLLEVGDLDWCLNAGGDVIVASRSGQPFVVGIQDPRDANRVASTLSLVEGAVATSGTSARGEHIYDPRSGTSSRARLLSVSVTGPSLETADTLATAAFVAGSSWWTLVDDLPDYAALAIEPNGTLLGTPSWPGSRAHRTVE